jgi:starch synthase
MKIIISCSAKFHAFNLVEELERNGVELVFFTSFASGKNNLFKYFVNRRDKEEIDYSSIRTNILVAFGLKIFHKNTQWVNDYFDWWVSREIKKLKADIFIGWSSMAAQSIVVAKSKGMVTILERGSAHIEVQNVLIQHAYREIGKRFAINPVTIKKELFEYGLVDFVSISSRFCLNTFIDKGVDKDKLIVNPYGVSDYFFPVVNSHTQSVTVLYLGKLTVRKGIHLLFQAINELHQNRVDVDFVFIGGIDNEIKGMIKNYCFDLQRVSFLGHVGHYELNKEIGKCDVAIVPSIEDGFAMVVPQILKVGIPVIVSENAGAEQMIVEGRNGWVISPRLDDIIERIEWCANNHCELVLMRKWIIKNNNTGELSWRKYGERYCNFLLNAYSSISN